MNNAQKVFLKCLGLIAYILAMMTSLINAIFDHSMIAQVIPGVLIGAFFVSIFVALGKEK